MPNKPDMKVVTKELIEMHKKVEKLSIFRDKFNFLEMIVEDIIKAILLAGMIYAYYKKDILLMLLFIGTAVLAVGYWKQKGDYGNK